MELYNQYLERLKTFVAHELTNWPDNTDSGHRHSANMILHFQQFTKWWIAPVPPCSAVAEDLEGWSFSYYFLSPVRVGVTPTLVSSHYSIMLATVFSGLTWKYSKYITFNLVSDISDWVLQTNLPYFQNVNFQFKPTSALLYNLFTIESEIALIDVRLRHFDKVMEFDTMLHSGNHTNITDKKTGFYNW